MFILHHVYQATQTVQIFLFHILRLFVDCHNLCRGWKLLKDLETVKQQHKKLALLGMQMAFVLVGTRTHSQFIFHTNNPRPFWGPSPNTSPLAALARFNFWPITDLLTWPITDSFILTSYKTTQQHWKQYKGGRTDLKIQYVILLALYQQQKKNSLLDINARTTRCTTEQRK